MPASIELRNTNADANAAESNTVCNFGDPGPCPAGDPGITLIPACNKLGAFSSCTGAEPGVIRVADTATGEAGSACAGMVFNVALADPANGQVRFTPQNGAHVTLVGSGAVCRIGFTFSVLRVPTTDQNPAAEGIQTVQVTDNTQFSGFLTASARGSSVGLRVERATPGDRDRRFAAGRRRRPGHRHGGRSSGLVSPSPGATVDFRLYGPDDADCSRTPVFESLGIPLGADGRAVSAPFTPTKPGVYRWRASYSGDANNNPVAGACNDAGEAVTVVGPPRITVNTAGQAGPVSRHEVHARRRREDSRPDRRPRHARRQDDQAHAARALQGPDPRGPALPRPPRDQGHGHGRGREADAHRRVPALRPDLAAALRRLARDALRPLGGSRDPPGGRRRGRAVAAVVAPPRRPRVGVRLRQLEAAAGAAGRVLARQVAAASS